ncbi:MAG: hypothetical protein WCC08_05925 [Terrimicrobiaceae bacterium]
MSTLPVTNVTVGAARKTFPTDRATAAYSPRRLIGNRFWPRGVGPESEAENVRFHGRRVTKVGPEARAPLLPKPEMAQDALDDILLVDVRNDAHFP